jgi:hypothetical protein
MKTIEAVVVVLIIALGASLALNYSLYASNQQLKSAGLIPQSVSTTNESLGLSLSVALSATYLQPGQGISITISEANTLNILNTVNVGTEWQFSPLSDSPCGVGSYPMGLAICQGYYTASNISTAEALNVYAYGMYACPMLYPLIYSYTFQPMSNMASINPSGGFFMPMNSALAANGYWGMTAKDFHSFSPGIYTVAGGDEWGQLALLHFVVV